MDEEIQKYLKIALDSGVSSYYRKDALRHLGRLRKSAELSNAVIKVLNDVDDPSLQREAMDLAAQFALTESVNLLLPISIGKGANARHAINVLAKIGGIKAYNCLKEIASAPGFDLSKTAAKRAIEDLLRREPDIEKQAVNETSGILEDAKNFVNEVVEKIAPAAVTPPPEKSVNEPQVNESQEKDRLTRELNTSRGKYNSLQREVTEKNARIEQLQDEIRKLKNSSDSANEIRELKKQVHETRNETASVKSAYEKQVALLQGKVISLEEENEDLLKSKGKMIPPKPAGNSGCFSFLIFVAIFVFIAWFIFSKITESNHTFDDIRDKIRIEQK